MFDQVVQHMQRFFDIPGACSADVHISGLRTGINISYLPDGIVVQGLHDRLPPYFRLEAGLVYLEEGDVPALKAESEDAMDYNIYYTWDPRKIAANGIQDERPIHGKTVWGASYDMSEFQPRLSPEMLNQFASGDSYLRDFEFVTTPAGPGKQPRLRQLSMWEHSQEPTLVTLHFRYKSGERAR